MRRAILSVFLFFALALPCQAQGDKAKPNTLTPKEIAEGWLLLFDGETTFGWDTKGNVRVENGSLLFPDENATIKHRTGWKDHELRFDFRVTVPGKPGKELLGGGGFELRGTDHARGFGSEKVEWSEFRCVFETTGKPNRFDLRMWTQGNLGTDVKNGQPQMGVLGLVQPEIFGSLSGSDLQVRNIKLRPLNTKSLFNGKDLTGWKEFPNKKSKFTVTDKGEINVKDGPGDLQTVGKYKDFILQLECISNGKHLNSGIFFRCRDNEYQNGYEAQIRNQFTPDATQKYLIEEYDPKTNKLLGKKEIMSTAFDYGTGAIYRRVPARKQMSKDGEWFGMTVVAHGNHLATWVNGVQVTDWYDNRPKSDNARTGCKLDAGHISIQGHDPTTDLSFKNFRIAEFK